MENSKLTDKERSLLLYCLRKHAPELVPEASKLDLSKTESSLVNEMRSAVGSEIMDKGFLKDDPKSHEYGKELDGLIDRLGDLYLWPGRKR